MESTQIGRLSRRIHPAAQRNQDLIQRICHVQSFSRGKSNKKHKKPLELLIPGRRRYKITSVARKRPPPSWGVFGRAP